MISASVSTAHQEQVVRSITWEVKFQMIVEFQARKIHIKITQGNASQLLYIWVINESQMYKKYPQSYDPCPLYYKRLKEMVFQYSLNKKQITVGEGGAFLMEFFKQHGHCVAPTQYPQN
jgi:hypothetical protein